MSQFLTQCPFCQTTFKVSDAQMQAANGVVRCGACMEVFLANQHRVILRDKPAPAVPEDRPAPQWQVVDAEDRPKSPDLFSSWEEEEDYRTAAAGPSGLPDDEPGDDALHDAGDTYPEADETPPDDGYAEAGIGDEAAAEEDAAVDDGDAPPAAETDDDTEDADDEPQEAPPEERPGYSGLLNPSGYSITQFSVESLLSGWFGNADEKQAQSAPEDDEEDAGERPDSVQPAVEKTAVIIREKGNHIPTLEPDVVAREEIPASGLGAQTLNWFQSLRQSFRDHQARKAGESEAESDEKAEIRRRLMTLRDEDALDPVDSAHLEALAAEPVELQGFREQWQRLRGSGLVAAGVVLVLALAGQYFWFNLDRLVLDRRMPAVTGLLCRLRTCPDAGAIDLSALVTEELVVRSHPDRAQALQVDFIFRNDRDREQRFPLVELNFTNNAGEVIANRVFRATEYLPSQMQLFTHMPAHSSIQARLELVDPGDQATGYYLVFRNP